MKRVAITATNPQLSATKLAAIRNYSIGEQFRSTRNDRNANS